MNLDTGILVVLTGYGGRASSNVHRHMREDFSDKWNMIVLHVDYFGLEHMQSEADPTVGEFVAHPRVIKANILWDVALSENENDLNDMGIMQGLDVVYAVKYIYEKYDSKINTNRIMVFGTSHGGYIAHLANILCPNLFSHLIDVSSYIKPYYMTKDRELIISFGEGLSVVQLYRYAVRIKGPFYDENIYDLSFLYRNIKNRCKILALHGVKDWMVNCQAKKMLIDHIDHAEIMVFEEKDIDGEVIKDVSHGLGLDFIKFIDMYLGTVFKGGGERNANPDKLFTPSKIKFFLEADMADGEIILSYVKGLVKLG